MSSFELTIVTPGGSVYQGPATRVTVRTTNGEVTILGHHINYACALGMGPATVETDGKERKACCIGGMLSMTNNTARLIASTFEWADEIDIERAQRALKRSEDRLANCAGEDDTAIRSYESARRRALARLSVAEAK